MIRGKGSVKEGKVGRKDGQMLPGEDEPLHALVTANTMENVKKAVEQVGSLHYTHINVQTLFSFLHRQTGFDASYVTDITPKAAFTAILVACLR